VWGGRACEFGIPVLIRNSVTPYASIVRSSFLGVKGHEMHTAAALAQNLSLPPPQPPPLPCIPLASSAEAVPWGGAGRLAAGAGGWRR
jgi:hypothetical protein